MDPSEHDEVLRDIVRNVEQNSDMDPNHPDLLTLKRILLEKICPAETGDGQASETIASADSRAAVPVDASVSQALGLSTTGHAATLPTDPAVRGALGLGTTLGQPSSPITGDSQPPTPSSTADLSAPTTEGA